MKRFLTVVFIIALLPAFSQAESGRKRHEVAFSYGGPSLRAFNCSIDPSPSFSHNSIGNFLDDSDFISRSRNIGVFSLSYHYYPKDWLAVGAIFGMTADYSTVMDANTLVESKFMSFFESYDLYVDVKFVYFRKTWIRLYSQVAIGGSVMCDNASRYFSGKDAVYEEFAVQTVPFGIAVGKSLSGFFQLELGTSVIGASAGISYRF